MFRRMTPNPRRTVTWVLIMSLWLQVITPPVMAASSGPSPIVGAINRAPGRVMATLALLEQSLVTFLRATLTPQESWNVVLTPVNTEFKDYAGVDYHHSSRKLMLSANTPAGLPHNFETIAADGTRSVFSNVAGLDGELLIATSRDEGQGMSRGGFVAGDLFTSTGALN